MASTGLSVNITGSSAGVEAMLMAMNTVISPIGLMGFLETDVDTYLRRRAVDRFKNEGDDVVGAWAPLKEATQAIRAGHGYGPDSPINKRTGELEEYITGTDAGVFATPGGAFLEMPGADAPPGAKGDLPEKFKTAQQGKADPATVARPVLGMNEADLGYVVTHLAFYVQTAGKKLLP